jgi:hypothetical protein
MVLSYVENARRAWRRLRRIFKEIVITDFKKIVAALIVYPNTRMSANKTEKPLIFTSFDCFNICKHENIP